MSKNPSDTQIMTTQGWKIKVPRFLKNKQYLITHVLTLTDDIIFINSQYICFQLTNKLIWERSVMLQRKIYSRPTRNIGLHISHFVTQNVS